MNIYDHIDEKYFNAEDILFDRDLVNECLINLRDSGRIIEYGSYYYVDVATEIFGEMRDLTEDELKAHTRGLDALSTFTGKSMF